MDDYSVILVKSTNQAMRIEHLLKMEEVPSKLIPVLRYLSSNCGNCVRILSSDKDKTAGILEKNHIPNDGIVALEG
jgi:ACT domain-containing protein